ncbi:MAG: threonylcarbamoyl-AMP synthase [Candidatus Hydrogenedentes bacterium]|nr:threonylcarbamoyl-AMP synthase [Candidatus Hydrogenedentota bacterium]
MRLVPPTPECIDEAAAIIRAGGVVAYPTETVYGLAADPFSVAAIESLFAMKGRSESNPILLIAANMEQVERIVSKISPDARAYMDRFWPGPLSLLLPKSDELPASLCAGGPKVCVRIPSSETARALCRAVGHAITSTSANRSGAPAPSAAATIELDGVALCIDGGALPPSLPSTVFDPDLRIVHRPGAVSDSTLLAF